MKVVVTRTVAGGVGLLERDPIITSLHVAEPGTGPNRRELLGLVQGAHGLLCQFVERIDAELLDAAGPQLKVVSNLAVGFDNFDIAEATRRGIWLTNTPDTVTPSTADMAWALMLAVSRRLYEGDREVRSGTFASKTGYDPMHLLGGDFEGKTLLIVGAGRIGYAVAQRSVGWGMRVLYVARKPHAEFEQAPFSGKRVTLHEGLTKADYVSLHVPLTAETHHLISERELRLMKETAILVNTSRGPVIDEAGLVKVLQERRIAGAGLDVYEFEPRQVPGLTELNNVFLMPHVGSASRDVRPRMAQMAMRNLLAALHGKRPENAINSVAG